MSNDINCSQCGQTVPLCLNCGHPLPKDWPDDIDICDKCEAILDEEERERAWDNGQFGVGA